MAGLSARLGSPRLAFILLCGLILWLGFGVALAQMDSTAKLVRSLDQGRWLEWLAGPAFADPVVAGWLAGLAVLGGLLLTNLACCSLAWLGGKGGGIGRRRMLLLVAHMVLALVILGHGASFLLGFKQTNLRLTPSQAIELPEGRRIKLLAVRYAADPALLALDHRQARRAMTRAALSRRDNWARVELTDAQGHGHAGLARYFDPVIQGATSAHLVGFFSVPGGADPAEIGAVLNLTSSPLAAPFFSVYAILLGCMAALLWLDRRRTGAGPARD